MLGVKRELSVRAGQAQVWSFVGDLGTAGGPLMGAGATAFVGLGPASLLVGILGIGGAAMIAFRMPEPLRRRITPET